MNDSALLRKLPQILSLLLVLWFVGLPVGAQAATSANAQAGAKTGPPAAKRAAFPDAGQRTPLTLIRQVRELPRSAQDGAFPVHLTGVVTALSGYGKSFFMQDATAGISVDHLTDNGGARVGDRIEVTGTNGAGMFAPVVLGRQVHVLGPAPLPAARPVTYGDMISGAEDSQWIEVQGIVHSSYIIQVFDRDTLLIVLDLGGARIRVLLQDFAGIDPRRLVDATMRVRGVCSTNFNARRQFVGLGLFVPDRHDIDILKPSPEEPYAAPTMPIQNTLQFGQMANRIKITGTVTYQIPGQMLYLQSGSDGIKVQTPSTERVPLGATVEALGFAAMGEYGPLLEDGIFRVVSVGNPLSPERISDARTVISRKGGFPQAIYDQQLVQIKGTVVENHVQGDQRIWILREQDLVYEATLPLSATTKEMAKLSVGSVILLTGICTTHVDSNREPVSFSVLLRSKSDLVVLERATWWTPGHTLLLLGILAGVTLLITLWVGILRVRVHEQTKVIRESEERFRNLAQNDVLTGLPNRLMLEERILECLALCKARNMKAVVFTADIDRFKHINDTYGHQIADECLKTVANRLRSKVRQTDTIARTGGEEFTVVIGCLPNCEAAKRVATTMLDLFLEPVVLPDREIKITVSIGGAIYPDDGTDTETLHKRSDQALYEAKRTGRNRAVFATDELAASSQMATSIEGSLREGLRADKFELYYQAVYDGIGFIRRFEALLRTTDDALGEIGLARFIPVAEESSLILPLGRWILEEACRQIAAWQITGAYTCPIAVNVSGKQLAQKGYADEVLQTIERFHIDPALLQLELTETSVMTEVGSVRETILRLAEAGLSFAIDDFGTGYSSLSRLHELPIKTLKIDRSFVQNLEQNGGSYNIVVAIIQMAKSLNVSVVAEGVETPEQFQVLKELGCDLFQGYLFAKPSPAASAIQTLRENHSVLSVEKFQGLPPTTLPQSIVAPTSSSSSAAL